MSVWLDGAGLEDISPRVKIKSIEPGVPALTLKTADNAKYGGVRFLSQKEGGRTVKITFHVLEANAERRRRVLEDVTAWALGAPGSGPGHAARLEIADEPDKYLGVRCTAFPSLDVRRDYVEDASVTFTAFDPSWKALHPTTASLKTTAGRAGSAYLTPPGTADTAFLEFEIKSIAAGAMNTAAVTVNGRSFSFAGLALAAGGTLAVRYDDDGRLSIATLDGMSKLHCRTAQSDDDLLLYQRKPNKVTVTTQTAAEVKLIGRGRYR